MPNDRIVKIAATYASLCADKDVHERSHLIEDAMNAALDEVIATLINERSLYLSKWKREAITACVERVRALKTKEGE